MCSDRRMHGLMQVDVDSGKTLLALFASMLAIVYGIQAAVMAPRTLVNHKRFST